MKTSQFTHTVIGNVDACRTEVEISQGDELVAIVFESDDGWQSEICGTAQQKGSLLQLDDAIRTAQEKLSHYVNRRGKDAPDGLTQAGLSLWLMEKDDGTTTGIRLKDTNQ